MAQPSGCESDVKYVPKTSSKNYNAPETKPFLEFLRLAAWLFLIILTVYGSSGFVVDYIATHYPERAEELIAPLASSILDKKNQPGSSEPRVQAILDKLIAALPPEHRGEYKLHISPEDEVNALAFPGRNILVYRGLLKRIHSENELAMVLGHELGHFAHHDHIRGLGRGVALVFLSALFLGSDSSATRLIGGSLDFLSKSFSREQEEQADAFGQDLVQKVYGHAGGSSDFFRELQKLEMNIFALKFLSTHPLSEERVNRLEERAREKGYPMRETIPLQF